MSYIIQVIRYKQIYMIHLLLQTFTVIVIFSTTINICLVNGCAIKLNANLVFYEEKDSIIFNRNILTTRVN